MTTTIRISPQMLEIIKGNYKVVVEPYPEKKTHDLNWYTLETFDLVKPNLYQQMSRNHMSADSFSFFYDHLATPQMSEPLIDKEEVSMEAFTALVNALKF